MLHRATSRISLFLLLAGLLAACTAPSPALLPSSTPSASPQATFTPITSPSATRTPTSRLPASPTPTPFRACSPLLGIAAQELSSIVANPYNPPPLGSDDPHQGVDLAQVRDGIAVSGLPVQAVLPGRVVLVVSGRFPYGNAVLVETPLDALPATYLEALDLPAVPSVPEKRTALTCPTPPSAVAFDFKQRSLYLLYAHLLEPPALSVRDEVACGQPIGAIGSSGNALNPHLHLEVRLGPAGAHFPGMAHYDTGATPNEMAAYCQWRVSGAFLTIDPLRLLAESQS
jgi:murein DD-endopeptidase MepM/ murein hydrolase activator NlpD